jgi:hypothetical protein
MCRRAEHSFDSATLRNYVDLGASPNSTGTADNLDITLLTPAFFAVRALEGVQVAGEEHEIMRDVR